MTVLFVGRPSARARLLRRSHPPHPLLFPRRICTGTGLTPTTSAPGPDTPLPRRLSWVCPPPPCPGCHIGARSEWSQSPPPQLRQNRAHPCPHLHRTRTHPLPELRQNRAAHCPHLHRDCGPPRSPPPPSPAGCPHLRRDWAQPRNPCEYSEYPCEHTASIAFPDRACTAAPV